MGFSSPVSLYKSVFFSPIIILFLQYLHKRSSHVPEMWPIQGYIIQGGKIILVFDKSYKEGKWQTRSACCLIVSRVVLSLSFLVITTFSFAILYIMTSRAFLCLSSKLLTSAWRSIKCLVFYIEIYSTFVKDRAYKSLVGPSLDVCLFCLGPIQ
jgi:hypothetical protein